MFLGLHQSKATGFDLDQKLGVFDTPAQKMVVQDQFYLLGVLHLQLKIITFNLFSLFSFFDLLTGQTKVFETSKLKS